MTISELLTSLYHVSAVLGALAMLSGSTAALVFAVKWKGKKLAGDEWKSLAEARGAEIADLRSKLEGLEKRLAKVEEHLEQTERENENLRKVNLQLQLKRA